MATFAIQEVLLLKDDPRGEKVFQIAVTYNQSEIKITRSLSAIRSFFEELCVSQRFGPLSLLTLRCAPGECPSAAMIERDLCDVLLAVSDNVWLHLDVVSFFDDIPGAAQLSKLHMVFLTKQVQSLMTLNANMERRLSLIEETLWLASNHAHTHAQTLSQPHTHSLSHSSDISPRSLITAAEIEKEATCARSEVSAETVSVSATSVERENERPRETENNEDSEDDDDEISLSAPATDRSHTTQSTQQREREKERNELASALTDALRHAHSPSQYALHDEVEKSVIALLLPSEEELRSQNALTQSLRELTRHSLGCALVPMGLHALGAALPEEVLCCSLLNGKQLFAAWHSALAERLSALSSSVSVSVNASTASDTHSHSQLSSSPSSSRVLGNNNNSNMNNSYYGLSNEANGFENSSVTGGTHTESCEVNTSPFVFSDVRFSSDETGGCYVLCNAAPNTNTASVAAAAAAVSSSAPVCSVEIRANKRAELVWLSLLCEASACVGRDSLFQRSLLLVRAWWRCEAAQFLSESSQNKPNDTRTTSENSVRDVSGYLSPQTLCALTLMVFNTHHTLIHTPLCALTLVLQTLLSIDAHSQAITAQGICELSHNTQQASQNTSTQAQNSPRTHNTHNSLSLILPSPTQLSHAPQSALLLPQALLHKYWSLTHPTQSATLSPYAHNAPSQALNVTLDARSALTVLHPLTLTHTERISSRRWQTIQRVCALTARRLCDALVAHNPLSQTCFRGICQRYSIRSRSLHSTNHHVALSHSSAILRESVESLWHNVLYGNFVLEGVVSESALLTAIVDSLTERGPCPVGEVGKMLTETASLPSLSLTLKESYGGLKKFLERFPNLFVFAADHPFNPHVLLRASLLPEHAQLCMHRGALPVHFVAMYKKSAPKKGPVRLQAGPAQVGASQTSLNTHPQHSFPHDVEPRAHTAHNTQTSVPRYPISVPTTHLSHTNGARSHSSSAHFASHTGAQDMNNQAYSLGGRNSNNNNSHFITQNFSSQSQKLTQQYAETSMFGKHSSMSFHGDSDTLSFSHAQRERERDNGLLWSGLSISDNNNNNNYGDRQQKAPNARNNVQFGDLFDNAQSSSGSSFNFFGNRF